MNKKKKIFKAYTVNAKKTQQDHGLHHLIDNEQSYANSMTKECFVSSLVKIDPVVLQKVWKSHQNINFHYYNIISPWKREWNFILKSSLVIVGQLVLKKVISLHQCLLTILPSSFFENSVAINT